MIAERMRNATMIAFWHIPWPNPEAYSICPWGDELLDGLLGSSILGFHTQFHRNNFLDTVDRLIEARVDRESFAVARGGRHTLVRRYPISIEWPPAQLATVASVADARRTIVLLSEHHEPHDVYAYLRAADLCFVSSLHDGMNLVAKEFVAARDDEAGVLVLSRFAGASRELSEALIVNPYDAEECAAALHEALTMRTAEQRWRMKQMRSFVRDFNVHRWAGRMLLDAAAMRRRGRLRSRAVVGAWV